MNARLVDLLTAEPVEIGEYVDVLGDMDEPPTGLAQRLMRTSFVPQIYERYWRPTLGRVAKGLTGPSMAEEHQFALENLALRKGDVVLDVASGTGGFTRDFARVVGSEGLAIGLDSSRTMLARAVAAGGGAVYLRADAVRPPLRDESLDAVCCFAALHMFAEPMVALDSFARLLKPGGRVALLTSGRRTWEPMRTVDTVLGQASGQRMFDRGKIAESLRARGFTAVVERYAGVTQLVAARKGE
ncbi:methyltransferase domain-containing protein [Kibdelosporangium philippinense]|uniref:Methyltransferase domain-containing protein n=1 Tax=Kibdelosporangium philippinense TaxID=211113 RepID=A0ABS8ZFD9_9PSEU|nr:methyltransferase domain-containing protein [Kibdelosporangium philippinense]MCE7006540.1 methyltransferase domain-containing protein [Kibdelosporangium philippinense]